MNEEPSSKDAASYAADFIVFAEVLEVRRLLPRDADPFSLVIRGHILLEHALIELLRDALPYSEELKSRLSFQHRVELNIATGLLTPDYGPFLEYVGDLRNRYAHNLRFELTAADEAALVGRLPPFVRELLSSYKPVPQFPEGLRRAILSTYLAIEGARKLLRDDEGRLGVVSKSRIRAMLEAAYAVTAGELSGEMSPSRGSSK